jgi:hypothetical protein
MRNGLADGDADAGPGSSNERSAELQLDRRTPFRVDSREGDLALPTARPSSVGRGAEAKPTSPVDDLTAREEDQATEVAELGYSWAAHGAEFETTSVGLERTDVSVEDPAAVWLPMA